MSICEIMSKNCHFFCLSVARPPSFYTIKEKFERKLCIISAIFCEMLAFYRNISKYWARGRISPETTIGIWVLSGEISKRDMGLLKRNIGYGQFTCGNDKFYSLIQYLPSVTQRHLGAWKVMWERQQLGRRAGALDIDLMSDQPGKQTSKLLSSLLGAVFEKRWKMLEGRATQVDLILLLAFQLVKRGGQTRYVRVFWIRCDVCSNSWLCSILL